MINTTTPSTKSTVMKPFRLSAQFGTMPTAIKRVELPCYRKAIRQHPRWNETVSASIAALAEDLGLEASARPCIYQIFPL